MQGVQRKRIYLSTTPLPHPLYSYTDQRVPSKSSPYFARRLSRECTKTEPVRAQRLLSFLINFANRGQHRWVCSLNFFLTVKNGRHGVYIAQQRPPLSSRLDPALRCLAEINGTGSAMNLRHPF